MGNKPFRRDTCWPPLSRPSALCFTRWLGRIAADLLEIQTECVLTRPVDFQSGRLIDGDRQKGSRLWALSWSAFGAKSPTASLGDVLVFVRNGGGHVGLYVGEDASAFHVLGGNQSDQVCITRVAKARLYAARRPLYRVQPDNVRPIHLEATGALSLSEA